MALIDNAAGRRVDIPHEPGEWMELRALTWQELDRARSVKQTQTFRELGEIGTDVMKQLQALQSGDLSAAAADPLATYDLRSVLEAGIVRWSYSDYVTVADIDRLDGTTARWAALEIVQPQSEEQRKNSSNGFTDASMVTESRPMSG